MIRNWVCLLCFLFLLSSYNAEKFYNETDEKKWISLFNGKNLDNWQIKIAGYKLGENFGNTFRVDSGLLSVRYNQYDSFNISLALYIIRRGFSITG